METGDLDNQLPRQPRDEPRPARESSREPKAPAARLLPESTWNEIASRDRVQLAHGGGRALRSLIEQLFLPALASPELARRHDSAVLDIEGLRLAFTTDTHVVSPLFFPGGDLGKLAITGTVNDLAMAGAVPKYLCAGFILEEGLPFDVLERVVRSMRSAARLARVEIVTGDTKVVARNQGDGLYISAAGLGVVPPGVDLAPARVQPGDVVLVSGDVGRHGIAVLAVRAGLALEETVASDCAPLATLVADMIDSGADLHCLRDLTRGGLAGALHDIALDAAVAIEIEEDAVPVLHAVHAASERLGIDALQAACEGRLVAFVPEAQADLVLERMTAHPLGGAACRIGRVLVPPPPGSTPQEAVEPGIVIARSALGARRALEPPLGEQQMRIG